MSHNTLTATKLRLILSIMLFVITAIGVGIVYFANTMLSKVATEVSHTVIDANASQNNLQVLQKTERELVSKQEIVKRAGDVVANSQSYQYQNQIINDLNHYASRSGIAVTNIDFSATDKSAGASTTTPGTQAPLAGVKTATISVTIKNPVDYTTLLRFMQSIEQNLTKMQISNISLSQDQSGVSSDVLSITVYVK